MVNIYDLVTEKLEVRIVKINCRDEAFFKRKRTEEKLLIVAKLSL